MAELDELKLTFKFRNPTKNKNRFEEELGEQSFSERDTAVGTLYVEKEALEMIGNPTKLKVTIEPLKEE